MYLKKWFHSEKGSQVETVWREKLIIDGSINSSMIMQYDIEEKEQSILNRYHIQEKDFKKSFYLNNPSITMKTFC
jgi:hypothetical protein